MARALNIRFLNPYLIICSNTLTTIDMGISMRLNNHKNVKSYTGYIMAVEKDKRGNTLQVALETDNFDRFIIGGNKMGRELINYIFKKVKVKGHIAGEQFNGNEIFFVTHYKIMN